MYDWGKSYYDSDFTTNTHPYEVRECSTQRKEKRKVEIIIDSELANSIFKDVHLVKDIRPAKQNLVLHTNTGKTNK